jgi:hypothetical protein
MFPKGFIFSMSPQLHPLPFSDFILIDLRTFPKIQTILSIGKLGEKSSIPLKTGKLLTIRAI